MCVFFLFLRRIANAKDKFVSLNVSCEKGVTIFAGGGSREGTYMESSELGMKKCIEGNN